MNDNEIRNVAIVAHVDHGKTSLVDQLLRQSGRFRQEEVAEDCILDSDPIERERGITILAKNCAIDYTARDNRRFHVNIIDTPGHDDFSGEVERVLRMADGILLVIDAAEGVMPQTRYVLSKALDVGLGPVIVLNKMDRPEARPSFVIDQIFDLLVDLGADDHALEAPLVYASARDGWASREEEGGAEDVHALFEAIIEYIPAPEAHVDAPLQALITTLDYNDYVGRIAIGRVFAGELRAASEVAVIDRSGKMTRQRVAQLQAFDGLGRREVESIGAGNLFAAIGLESFEIGETIGDVDQPLALPPVSLDEPVMNMRFRMNDSPFAGREGSFVTGRQVRERLLREIRSNVALRVEEQGEELIVFGRGLLHLGILIENMRREGYELSVSRPEMLYGTDEKGRRTEPIEILVVDSPPDYVGAVMALIGDRRATVLQMDARDAYTHMEFEIPARGLIGVRDRLLMATQGEAAMNHRYLRHGPFAGEIPGRTSGAMIALHTGQVTGYALNQLADRGVMFLGPGEEVYEGQIVGEHCKDDDITVNVTRQKAMTNMRSSTKDLMISLKAPRRLSLEAALEYIEDDELVEVTPKSIRLRKRFLREPDRRKERRGGRGRMR